MKNSVQFKHGVKMTLAASIVLLASGCGSSADPAPEPIVIEPDVPTATATSLPALISFATLKTNSDDETIEPLNVGANDLVTSETEEPDASV
jgi:hypothetical protein